MTCGAWKPRLPSPIQPPAQGVRGQALRSSGTGSRASRQPTAWLSRKGKVAALLSQLESGQASSRGLTWLGEVSPVAVAETRINGHGSPLTERKETLSSLPSRHFHPTQRQPH